MTYNFELARGIAGLKAAALAAILLFAGACDNDNLTETESITQTDVEEVVTDGSDALAVEDAAFSVSANRKGVPFGMWRLQYTQLGAEWTSLQKAGNPKYIKRDLELARSRGARVFVQLAGGVANYKTGSKFDLAKFKKMLDQYKGLNLDSYIADGTLAGHMMIDEPSDPSNWGGKPIPYSTLDEAARHSKSIWPNLPTLLRSKPSWLAKYGWKHLDGGWAQYAARFGDINRWRDTEARAANNANLKVAWGLNVLDGGNGSSRWRGTKSGAYNMSPAELKKYGSSLLAAPGSCAFLMWRFDNTYLGRSGIKTAMKDLRQVASSKATTTCKGGR